MKSNTDAEDIQQLVGSKRDRNLLCCNQSNCSIRSSSCNKSSSRSQTRKMMSSHHVEPAKNQATPKRKQEEEHMNNTVWKVFFTNITLLHHAFFLMQSTIFVSRHCLRHSSPSSQLYYPSPHRISNESSNVAHLLSPALFDACCDDSFAG